MTQPAILHNTEVHVLHSDIMDFDYEITVQKPAFPAPGPLPVAFSTDANALLAVTCNAFDMLLMNGEMPPMLNINIGYPVGTDLIYVLGRRPYDYTMTDHDIFIDAFNRTLKEMNHSMVATSGGADKFSRFLEEELWPWVVENYEVTDDRTYIGNSLAAYYGLYHVFTRPGFFKRYILGSCQLDWDPEIIDAAEEQYASEHDDLPVTVFMCAGDSEDFVTPAMDPGMAEGFRRAKLVEKGKAFVSKLQARNYPGLKIDYQVFPNQSHNMSPFTSIPHGLKYVFSED